ncbi:MAG: DUF2807 domain-containing protein [Myxococcaceae bacterium]|nr:DUF2807 domain-containing protein [Myxococcaceae bacterium]MCA3016895.1 DUF2807 domain-containing protein [Myxococcaceae bacterium]
MVILGLLGSACPTARDGPGVHRLALSRLRSVTVEGPVSARIVTSPGEAGQLQLDVSGEGAAGVRWVLDGEALRVEAPTTLPADDVQLVIEAPSVAAVSASEGARVTVSRLFGGRLKLDARRGARLVVETADADTLVVEAGRDASVDVAGRARQLELRADDVGEVQARALAVAVARVEASGLSSVVLGAPRVLRASLRQASWLTVTTAAPQQLVTVDEGSSFRVAAPQEPTGGTASARRPTPPGAGYPGRRIGTWGMPSSSYGAPSTAKPSEP